jgi:tripartite-type tricarboxylate transporter receptor subunit TctC
VPFTPGGSTDILARAIGQELTRAWGQSVIVDNVPGAGGAIGADKVAKAPADGYTLLMGHIGTLAVNPSLYPKLPYNPLKDFAPVAGVARVPNVLVVHPSVPAKDVRELVALAKAKPGPAQLRLGRQRQRSQPGHRVFQAADRRLDGAHPVQGHRAGRDRPDRRPDPGAVHRCAGRHRPHQERPAARAGGLQPEAAWTPCPTCPRWPRPPAYKDFEADQWYGVVAPAGTPREVISKLNAQINAALNTPELKARLTAEGAVAMPGTPEAFGQLMAGEITRWKPVITSGRVKAD